MCAIIDPPLFIAIINSSDGRHHRFGALKDWLLKGKGKAITGGSKYREELRKIASVLPFLTELNRKGKLHPLNDVLVDNAALFAKSIANTSDFDDEHLIGIAAVSGCNLICLDDARAHKYIKNKHLYLPERSRPRIFSGQNDLKLLGARYTCQLCK